MQLIDRDKLKSALNNEIISHDIGNIYDRYYREGLMCAMLHLGSQPTIEERKHGHWVTGENEDDGDFIIKCSICGKRAPTDGDYRYYLSNYCPHCSAKMDEEIKNE